MRTTAARTVVLRTLVKTHCNVEWEQEKHTHTTCLPGEGQAYTEIPITLGGWGGELRRPQPRNLRKWCRYKTESQSEQRQHPILLLAPQCQAKELRITGNKSAWRETGEQECAERPFLRYSAKGRPKTRTEQVTFL